MASFGGTPLHMIASINETISRQLTTILTYWIRVMLLLSYHLMVHFYVVYYFQS